MFEIEGLFMNDLSVSHLNAVRSLANYLDEILAEKLTADALFFMQSKIYEIQDAGAHALTNSAMQDRKFDCKKGCDSCCYATHVDITPAEAFYLADYIRREHELQNDEYFSIPPRLNKMAACPLLKAGVCSAYDARPLSCRYILSTDIASCLKRLETLTGGAKLPAPFSHFRSSIAVASFIVFRKRRLDARWLVLDKTIELIVNDESALANWISGKSMDNKMMAEQPAGKFEEMIVEVEKLV